jgi:hypothetical protein
MQLLWCWLFGLLLLGSAYASEPSEPAEDGGGDDGNDDVTGIIVLAIVSIVVCLPLLCCFGALLRNNWQKAKAEKQGAATAVEKSTGQTGKGSRTGAPVSAPLLSFKFENL